MHIFTVNNGTSCNMEFSIRILTCSFFTHSFVTHNCHNYYLNLDSEFFNYDLLFCSRELYEQEEMLEEMYQERLGLLHKSMKKQQSRSVYNAVLPYSRLFSCGFNFRTAGAGRKLDFEKFFLPI